jgi:hypothetical protein
MQIHVITGDTPQLFSDFPDVPVGAWRLPQCPRSFSSCVCSLTWSVRRNHSSLLSSLTLGFLSIGGERTSAVFGRDV